MTIPLKKIYPIRVIGEGANKEVFNVSSRLKDDDDDVLLQKEREDMSLTVKKGTNSKNLVLVRPKLTLTEKELQNFIEEFELQAKFSRLGLAPKVLEVNSKLKIGNTIHHTHTHIDAISIFANMTLQRYRIN